jgi:glutathione S-transferase
MPDLMLYHCPPACSRITMIALEETGLPYSDTLIKLMEGQQRTTEYLAVNPKGKVPALRIDTVVLTENPVILNYLNQLAPGAGLLPRTDNAVSQAQQLADLVWASSALHGQTLRQVIAPFRMTDADPAGLKVKGTAQLAEQAEAICARLAAGGWWYGKDWSIMDVYIFWIFSTAQTVGGFDLSAFPRLVELFERVRARPAFLRTLAREKAALDRAGVTLPTAPPPHAPARP